MDEKTCGLICDVENIFHDVHRGIRAIGSAAQAREFSAEYMSDAVTYVSDRLFADVNDLEKKVNELIEVVKELKLGGVANAKG